MGDRISKNIIVVIIALAASVIGIVVFVTGKNLPDFFEESVSSDHLSDSETEVPESSQINAEEESSAQQADHFELTGSVVHFPNTISGDYTIGGVWKLQGIHEAAYSFSQRVEVYSIAAPDQILYYGAASYDVEWSECDDGTYTEVPSNFDQITQYDYPSGTYGTFRVDLSSPTISAGQYECRLVLYINEVCYTYSIPFEI